MIINSIVYVMTLLLVLYFIFITYKIYSKKRKIKFPPIDAECPNYYIPKNKLGRKICIAKPIYKIYDKIFLQKQLILKFNYYHIQENHQNHHLILLNHPTYMYF